MECFLVAFGRWQPETFCGVYVHRYGDGAVFHGTECLDEFAEVVAIFHIQVFESERAEIVAFGCAVCFTQFLKVVIEAALVRGYAHLVVVDGIVQPFECFPATEGAVADYGHHVFAAATQVAGFGQS